MNRLIAHKNFFVKTANVHADRDRFGAYLSGSMQHSAAAAAFDFVFLTCIHLVNLHSSNQLVAKEAILRTCCAVLLDVNYPRLH